MKKNVNQWSLYKPNCFWAIKYQEYFIGGTYYTRKDATKSMDESGYSWKSMNKCGYSVVKVFVVEAK